MAHRFSNKQRAYIKDHACGRTALELTTLFNDHFGMDLNVNQIRAFKKNHKIRSGIGNGIPKGSPTKLYPREIREFIHKNFRGNGPHKMAAILNRRFDTSYTAKQIKSFYGNNGLSSGETGHYEKGHTPWLKGRTRTWDSPSEFRKGNVPENHLSVGTEVVNTDGYVVVKIAEPNIWEPKHRLIWEEHHGKPVPEGHKLSFLDQNRLNVTIDNLILLTDQQHFVMNQMSLYSTDPEQTKTGVGIAKLTRKIHERYAELNT